MITHQRRNVDGGRLKFCILRPHIHILLSISPFSLKLPSSHLERSLPAYKHPTYSTLRPRCRHIKTKVINCQYADQVHCGGCSSLHGNSRGKPEHHRQSCSCTLEFRPFLTSLMQGLVIQGNRGCVELSFFRVPRGCLFLSCQ